MSTEDYLSDEEELQPNTKTSKDEKTSTANSTTLEASNDTEELSNSVTSKDSEELEAVKFLEVLVPKESLVRKRAFSALLRQIVER